MALITPRRQAGSEGRCWSISAGWNRRISPAGLIRPTRRSASASAPAGIGARRCTARSPKRTSWRSRRRSATTGRHTAIDGPLFMGKDTHALSAPAQRTALEVLAANGVETDHSARRRLYADAGHLARHPDLQPGPRSDRLADGIVITPSHNPPEDGGFKYNPPNGGPADTDVTRWIEDRANELLRAGHRWRASGSPFAAALSAATTHQDDLRACPMSTICGTSSTWTRFAMRG